MRAALIHANGTLWLAGDPAATERSHPPAGNLRIDADMELQTDGYVRAAAVVRRDRGNLATVVAFDTSRIFGTPTEAGVWAGAYDGSQPRTGTLVLCDTNAGVLPLLNFPGAVVRPPRRQVIGCTVLLGYEVMCGLPVAVTAASGTVEVSGALAGDTLNLFGYVFTATDAANPAPPLWNKTAAGLAAAITAQRGWLVTAHPNAPLVSHGRAQDRDPDGGGRRRCRGGGSQEDHGQRQGTHRGDGTTRHGGQTRHANQPGPGAGVCRSGPSGGASVRRAGQHGQRCAAGRAGHGGQAGPGGQGHQQPGQRGQRRGPGVRGGRAVWRGDRRASGSHAAKSQIGAG